MDMVAALKNRLANAGKDSQIPGMKPPTKPAVQASPMQPLGKEKVSASPVEEAISALQSIIASPDVSEDDKMALERAVNSLRGGAGGMKKETPMNPKEKRGFSKVKESFMGTPAEELGMNNE